MQKGLKATGETSSWETPLGGGSVIRKPNRSLVLGADCSLPTITAAIGGQTRCGQRALGKGLFAVWQDNKVVEGDGNKGRKDKCCGDWSKTW